MNKTLDWIKGVREGCKKIILKDLDIVIKEMKKGNINTTKFHVLLSEIRDNERDEALLSLIQEMLEEDYISVRKDEQ